MDTPVFSEYLIHKMDAQLPNNYIVYIYMYVYVYLYVMYMYIYIFFIIDLFSSVWDWTTTIPIQTSIPINLHRLVRYRTMVQAQ